MLRHPVTAVRDGLEIINIEMGVETIGINVMAQEGTIEWEKEDQEGKLKILIYNEYIEEEKSTKEIDKQAEKQEIQKVSLWRSKGIKRLKERVNSSVNVV